MHTSPKIPPPREPPWHRGLLTNLIRFDDRNNLVDGHTRADSLGDLYYGALRDGLCHFRDVHNDLCRQPCRRMQRGDAAEQRGATRR